MESEPNPTPKLPLFSLPPLHSSEPLTPLHTSASVPFRWEEKPGKPIPCTTLVVSEPNSKPPKCLDLPPRLLIIDHKITKTPSPTTVLDGPYKAIFASSFRFSSRRQGSFDSWSGSPDGGQFGNLGQKGRGFWGSFRKRGWKLNDGKEGSFGSRGSFVFSQSVEDEGFESDGTRRMRRNGSFYRLSQTRSHFWTAIYKGFKQAIPWKSRKSREGGIIV